LTLFYKRVYDSEVFGFYEIGNLLFEKIDENLLGLKPFGVSYFERSLLVKV
jgi:hypothetical protein